MNFRQKRMLLVVALAGAAVLLWPPVDVRVTPSLTELQYVFLFSDYDGTVHVMLLIAECLALCLLGVLCYRSLDGKTERKTDNATHGRKSA